MRKTFYTTLTFLAVAFTSSLFAQDATLQEDPRVTKLPLQEVPRAGRIIASENAKHDDWAQQMRNTKVIHQPGVNLEKDYYIRVKQEANRLADDMAGVTAPAGKTAALNPVEVGVQFTGNSYDGIPNDNTLAVGADGKMVSLHNSRIHMYNGVTGTPITGMSLQSFISGSGLPNHDKFDPKAVYDPTNDRYVVVFLNGFSSSTSKIIVGFSETNDPAGAWNLYGIAGNPLAGTWTDFPQIAISTSELFITGNLFDDSDMSQGSAIWQIELADGYAGTSLTTQVRTTTYFSLHPVGGGLNLYGPHMYIIRVDEVGPSKSVYLHKITNTIASGTGTLMSPYTFTSDNSYFAPPDAPQKGTTRMLSTNTNRVQSSYMENNIIMFTCNTGFSGTSAIYLGQIILSLLDLSFSAAYGDYITYPDYYLGYGAVAYGGAAGSSTNETFVMYNYSSSTEYPGNGATWFSGDGDMSPMKVLKTGTSNIGFGSAAFRWGDYADLAERPGTTGEAWVVGSFGLSLGSCGTYISQIFPPLPVNEDQPVYTVSDGDLTAYPNPATEMVHFDFSVPQNDSYTVNIYDLSGKLVKNLLSDRLRKGEARLNFSVEPLPAGIYLVDVRSASGIVLQQKLSVTK